MKSIAQKIKSKNLTIRMSQEVYDFISASAKKQGITKSAFFISQLDSNSELITYIDDARKRLEKEIEQIKSEYEEYVKTSDKEIASMLEESDDKTILSLYKGAKDDSRIKKVFQKVAKKRGISLPN